MYVCMNVCMYIHIYIHIYNFVCHVQKCQYISKTRHLFLNELYLGFLQTFEDSIK